MQNMENIKNKIKLKNKKLKLHQASTGMKIPQKGHFQSYIFSPNNDTFTNSNMQS